MNVLLEQSWTDRRGVTHGPGESVDVDTVTLAQLEATGVVAAPEEEVLMSLSTSVEEKADSSGETGSTGTRQKTDPEQEKIVIRPVRMGPGSETQNVASDQSC